MKFRTELQPIQYPQKIALDHSIITIGSCFSNTIGSALADNKLDCLVNPFGTIYDPISMTRLLKMAMTDTQPTDDTLVESDGVWKSLLLHSSFSGLSKDELALKIRAKFDQVRKELVNTNWLMMTFGTAFVYTFKDSGDPIANCQKLPASSFRKELWSHANLLKDFEVFLPMLREFNPNIRLILTVSPVRHIRDGITENSVSKSILRILSNTLTRDFEQVDYYPSYEILMDDLRDYRFYKEDLIHPNEQADNYIWNHFSKSFFDNELAEFTELWTKLKVSLRHRPFNPYSQEHQQFLIRLLGELEDLSSRVNLTKEIELVKDQILDEQ